MNKKYIKFKRTMDFLGAVILLIISSPVFLCVSFYYKFVNKGPMLYKSERIGKNGKIFSIMKFRTMITKLHEEGKKLSDKERLFPFGLFLRKTSLDELPQLLNIIKGEMSFIGPRPLPVQYYDYFTEEEFKRHNILPGISGLAQINGRNNLCWEEKFKYDLEYLENISFRLDLKIFFKTLAIIFSRSGVNVRDEADSGNLDDLRK
jgi:lipopolysaccharide/colanic/teichoic acid biosynthesis glycosyltransferase